MLDISTKAILSDSKLREGQRFLIFAPWCYGHHPTYVQHLVRYWTLHQLPGILHVLVSPEFFSAHSDVAALSKESVQKTVHFVAMEKQEYAALEANPSNFKRAVLQHQLICRYAKRLEITRGLVLYLDSCLLPLVAGAKFPCRFSGIYYRPTLHYDQFQSERPSARTRLQKWKEQVFLFRVLQNSSIKTLFSLDPFAIDTIKRLGGTAEVLHLPDPAPFAYSEDRPVELLRQKLGVESDRRVFLFFGRLSEERKGIPQLVQAISLLPTALRQKMCLLLAGEPMGAGAAKIESWLSLIIDAGVQIVNCHGYIPEDEVANYFQLADVVLAPYQRHIGMSGILLLAAAARKPILSSNYGLMGEIVRQHELGVAIDSTLPQEIAQGIERFLSNQSDKVCSYDRMQAFAEAHSAEQFAEVIFSYM